MISFNPPSYPQNPILKMKKQVQVKTNVLPWNDKIWVHIPFLKLCGLGFGKNSPGALHASDSGSVYRITGEDQITDLLTSGFVRPKQSGKVKGGRTNEVH